LSHTPHHTKSPLGSRGRDILELPGELLRKVFKQDGGGKNSKNCTFLTSRSLYLWNGRR